MKAANKNRRARMLGMDRAAKLESIFPGDSEMARLMRAFDWSTSEVGVPENWPESLKAAVRICVGSGNPIAGFYRLEDLPVFWDAAQNSH
jgi:hypothetical protein